MASNLYDKHDIEKLLGLNHRQLRNRLSHLDSFIKPHLQEGKRGATLIDDGGFAILKRLVELERDNRTIADAVNLIEKEMESLDENSDKGDGKVSQDDVNLEALKAQIEALKHHNQFLESEVERLHGKIDRLLPGRVNNKGFLRRVWERVW